MVHKCELRVRYSDTDQMRRMHHGAFVDYLEVARIEMLRSMGISYAQLEGEGYALPVIELNIQYLGAAHYDDVIQFATQVEVQSPIRLRFESELFVREARIAKARVDLACLDGVSFRPKKMPQELIEKLAG